MFRNLSISIFMVGTLAAFACNSNDEANAVRPVALPGPPTGDDAGSDGGGVPGECKSFASEYEQLLNAPTETASIKKKVELPPP